jgi:hypothetical protein
MIVEIAAFLLSVLSSGRVDYLPGARRPWVVDWRKGRRVGRGRTLVEAVRGGFGWKL